MYYLHRNRSSQKNIKQYLKRGLVFILIILFQLTSFIPFISYSYAQEATASSVVNIISPAPTNNSTPAITPQPSVSPNPPPVDWADQPISQQSTKSAILKPTNAPIVTPLPTTSPTLTPIPEISATPTIQPFLTLSPAFLPSATIRFKPKVQTLAKHDFRSTERIKFTIENTENNDVNIKIVDISGRETAFYIKKEIVGTSTRLTIIPTVQLKPGKYTLIVSDTNGTVAKQDFTWGVLAINTHKSVYLPHETAKLALAVLDQQGGMVCDAKLKLIIKNEALNINDELSTENGLIQTTPDCHAHDLTANPDYQASYHTGAAGIYTMQLTAQSINGTYTIDDSFEVKEYVPFDVERLSATRIYPPNIYPVILKITAHEDFTGDVTEYLPESFTVKPLDGSKKYDSVTVQSIIDNYPTDTIQLRLPFDDPHPETLGFGEQLTDPYQKDLYSKFGLAGHDGVDFDMSIGTPIIAADDGTVILAGPGAYGTTLVLQHSWGKSYYGHLGDIAVKMDQKVSKGDKIALSSNTGPTTGPHLHFGIKLNNNDPKNGYFGKTDPLPYLNATASVSPYPEKVITWKVSLKKGDKADLGYQFIAPQNSPEFYLLGPLKFMAPKISDNQNPFVLGTATDGEVSKQATSSAEILSTPSATLTPSSVSVPSGVSSVVFQEARKWQIAADAAPTLNTLLPTAYSSQTGTAWTTTTVGNIDEGIAGADGLFIVAGANSTSSIFYDVTDTPSDFVTMITLNYDIRYKITPLSNDTEVLYVQVFKSDKTTSLTNEMTVVSTTTALTIRNKGVTAFTGVSTTATKAEWNAAYFRIRTSHSASGGKDNSVWSIDAFEVTGTYQTSPTVALNTPADTATGQSTTPALNFTGTDSNSDTVEYNVQIDTNSSFNSTNQAGFYLKYIDVDLDKRGSPTDNLTFEVRSTSISGTSLGTSNNVSASSLSAGVNYNVRFTFASSIYLNTGTKYYLVMSRSGSADFINFTGWYYENDSYGGGEAYENNSGVWSTNSGIDFTGFDLYDSNLNTVLTVSSAYYSVNRGPYGATTTDQQVGQSFIVSTLLGPLLDKYSVSDTGFTAGHPFGSGTAINYTVQAADTLSANTTYYWRVRAIDPSGTNTYGAWSSPTWSFTTSSSGPANDQLMRHGAWFNSGTKQSFTF